MIEILNADLSSPTHGRAIVDLLNFYAIGHTGGGQGISTHVRENLVAELRKRPNMHVVLALVNGSPAGLAICIEGFSTFACKPLLNIHDFMVAEPYQRRGIARMMLAKTEEIARAIGCCKLTLEVLEGNAPARALYESFGFAGYELDPTMGKALFWQKKL